MSLKNSTIIVTGAAGTLGQAVCRLAQSKGATVIGLDIVATPSVPHTDNYYRTDLLDLEATQARFSSIDKFDALINVAGGFTMGEKAFDASDEQFDLMFKINVTTLRNAVKSAVPAMRSQQRGAIVNIGALGALTGQADISAYCAAKSTVMRLTESLSEELKADGVNVNAVLPSIIDTPPNREAMPEANFDDWVAPENLAEVICFLASDEASAVHGALIPVKGLV